MDPFNEVKEDAYSSVRTLESIINSRPNGQPPSYEQQHDFENNYQELQEIYQDLQQALSISEAQPSKFNLSDIDISNRKSILSDLNNKISQLGNTWNAKQYRDVTTMSNRISQDGNEEENPFGDDAALTSYQQQELIQEQDTQLDDIHRTMMNLNQQAVIMGDELEEQGFMLDELDYELDNVDNKLQRGMKRINIFLERNKETASNWCIGILAVVLCILLVLLIVV
ncbi:TLG1 t-SNARE affecting a late Golgi compartment protein 1 [Candida maltosa Xu316]|uniref:t-SNARE affecting a late Golgi compartment protein 1 n=1 Tax=Candida maltosa (strain Xu316) TaxID=1245528 RepID=M3HGN3_CANMX|nr:t-SNARE syntaxin protein, vesicular/late Golgi fusion, putative (T-snare protein, putative) [Candida maltosa Xu316]